MVGVDDIVDGQLAGNLTIVTVEGVIPDAFVAAQLLVVGGRGQGEIVDPGRRRRLELGALGFGVGRTWREMVCGTAFP